MPSSPAAWLRPALLISLGLTGLATELRPAHAHAIESSLERLGHLHQQLQLEAHFSNGLPLEGAAVRLIPPTGGEGVLVGRTNGSGELRFRLPGGVDPAWEVQIDGGSGHRDYLELPAAAAPASAGAGISSSGQIPLWRRVLPGLRAEPLLAGVLLGLLGTALRRRR